MVQNRTGSRPRGRKGWFAVSMTIGGRDRTFAPGAWLSLTIGVVVPALTIWSLVTTLYVAFHDQLLASLIARQADMQYAYEDRIADLRTQLDRETSRGLVDRHTLDTTLRDLEDRSALLESRAAAVDRLVAQNFKSSGNADAPDLSVEKTRTRPVASRNPLLGLGRMPGLPNDVTAYSGAEPSRTAVPAAGPLRLEDVADPITPSQRPNPRARTSDKSTALDTTITRILANVDRSQVETLAALREPTLRSIARLKAALAEVGLPANLKSMLSRGAPLDVGGPFVPLASLQGTLTFDQNAALLQDALVQVDRLKELVAKIPLRKPVNGDLEVSSTFGPRLDPFLGRPAMHTGIDFREPYGESVRSTASGTVTIAGSDGGYGTMVEVDHGNGLSTRYAHLSSVSVSPNQKVAAGEIVGHVGSSGRATGPHLHYETRINGEPIDPTRFLKAGATAFDD